MATKKTGIVETVKSAVVGFFDPKPARKSPKRVAAGKKAATTAKVTKVAKAAKKSVKKAVAATKKAATKAAK
jgi:uncharacterized membrane protein (UPF0182 family)